MMCAAACNHEDNTEPAFTGKERTIVYTIDNTESRISLKTNLEWDALLDRFCGYAQEGRSVTFFNLRSQFQSTKAAKSTGNETSTCTTTSKDEIKAWMRQMELAGKTVNVTYDEQTGVWHGTAYANAPVVQDTMARYTGVVCYANMPALTDPILPALVWALRINADTTLILIRDNHLLITGEEDLDNYQEGDTATLGGTLYTIEDQNGGTVFLLDITEHNIPAVEGTWNYSCLTEYAYTNGSYPSITQYLPAGDGNEIHYTFRNDGTATMSVSGVQTQSVDGTWSLSGNGQLCCDLLEAGGGCWSINWLTNNSMIISRMAMGDTLYQMELEKN